MYYDRREGGGNDRRRARSPARRIRRRTRAIKNHSPAVFRGRAVLAAGPESGTAEKPILRMPPPGRIAGAVASGWFREPRFVRLLYLEFRVSAALSVPSGVRFFVACCHSG